MALNWVLHDERVTPVIVGVSRVEHLEANVQALQRAHPFADEERRRIRPVLES